MGRVGSQSASAIFDGLAVFVVPPLGGKPVGCPSQSSHSPAKADTTNCYTDDLKTSSAIADADRADTRLKRIKNVTQIGVEYRITNRLVTVRLSGPDLPECGSRCQRR